jgi:hypothetical protein
VIGDVGSEKKGRTEDNLHIYGLGYRINSGVGLLLSNMWEEEAFVGWGRYIQFRTWQI